MRKRRWIWRNLGGRSVVVRCLCFNTSLRTAENRCHGGKDTAVERKRWCVMKMGTLPERVGTEGISSHLSGCEQLLHGS